MPFHLNTTKHTHNDHSALGSIYNLGSAATMSGTQNQQGQQGLTRQPAQRDPRKTPPQQRPGYQPPAQPSTPQQQINQRGSIQQTPQQMYGQASGPAGTQPSTPPQQDRGRQPSIQQTPRNMYGSPAPTQPVTPPIQQQPRNSIQDTPSHMYSSPALATGPPPGTQTFQQFQAAMNRNAAERSRSRSPTKRGQ